MQMYLNHNFAEGKSVYLFKNMGDKRGTSAILKKIPLSSKIEL